jgi:branched-chain amino acid transport system ATP-binding protein
MTESKAPQNKPVLKVENVASGYRDLEILRDVSLECRPGAITTVIGPNGSGKSTLMRCIAGLLPLRRGEIFLMDRQLTRLPIHRRVASGLAFVPQEHTLFPDMTVEENLLLGGIRWEGRSKQQARRGLERTFEMYPALHDWKSKRAGLMSGGQQRLIAIARAMVSMPDVLVLDEPTAGLSPKVATEMLGSLTAICKSHGVTVLLVEQNIREAVDIASYVYSIVQGQNDAHGESKEIRDCLPELVRSWLLGRAAKAAQ